MVTIQDLFKWGMDREIPQLIDPPEGLKQLNLGPGNIKDIPNTIGVGRIEEKMTLVEWEFPEILPFDDGTIGAVHAYHFLEHFDGDDCVELLWDIQRVLAPGGVAFICTPYPDTPNFWRALDHKSAWCEETWDWLFANPYYSGWRGGQWTKKDNWQLKVHTTFIMGIVERNRALLTQLVKASG